MASNSKPAGELRIGAVKATIWENEVGGITRHNVTFSRIYRDEGQWKTRQSFGFKNLLTLAKVADQAHTLIAERNAEAASAAEGQRSRINGRTLRRRVHPRRISLVCRDLAHPKKAGVHDEDPRVGWWRKLLLHYSILTTAWGRTS